MIVFRSVSFTTNSKHLLASPLYCIILIHNTYFIVLYTTGTHHDPVVLARAPVAPADGLLQVEVLEGEGDLPAGRRGDGPGAGVPVGETVGVAGAGDHPRACLELAPAF